jgi:predicted permease
LNWLSRLFRRAALERDLAREIKFHVETATEDLMRAGYAETEARRLARLELGGPEQIKEATRDARGTRWVEDWWSDTGYALRTIARTPGFAIASVLTLGLGVGANTAVWSITDALMRRPLPVERPGELYAVHRVGTDEPNYRTSHPLMLRMRSTVQGLAQIVATGGIAHGYATIRERPDALLFQLVSGNFFNVLGVRPLAGRLIEPADDETVGGGPVAVISDAYWESRFSRDPSVIGRSIRFNGVNLTVVGVTPAGFGGLTVGTPVSMYIPLAMQHDVRYSTGAASFNADPSKPWVPQRGVSWLTLTARVDAAHVREATARLETVLRSDLRETLAQRDQTAREAAMKEHVELESIARGFSPLRDQFADPLRALTAGVAIILLIACANLAGLLLARSAARSQEIAIRVSLGARPGRLVRQVVTESLTLALLGGIVGIGIARWATQTLLRLASSGTRAIPLDTPLDAKVLLFAFAITIAAGLLFGLAPAHRVARTDLYERFRIGSHVAAGGASHRVPLGRLLVAGQIALSLLLVTSAGVFVKTFQNLLDIETGFERERLVMARIDTRSAGYSHTELPALYDRLLAAARAVPGAKSASLSYIGLADGGRIISEFELSGRRIPAQENYVTPEFFSTAGVTLVRGRLFTDRDTKDTPKVVVITETAARRFFGTDDVVGRHFGYDANAELEIVGVTRDVRANSLREPMPPMVYRALAQDPRQYVSSVDVRVSGNPESVIAGLRSALMNVDKRLPVREVVTAENILERGLSRERMVARLAGSFGILALLLAAIGLYGVISFSVSRRTNEMGVRLALGATPGSVRWIVLRDALATIVAGLVVGVMLWAPLLGLTRRLVYGLSPHDPQTLGVGALVLVAVGAVAALIPAVRASRIDPIAAIRAE